MVEIMAKPCPCRQLDSSHELLGLVVDPQRRVLGSVQALGGGTEGAGGGAAARPQKVRPVRAASGPGAPPALLRTGLRVLDGLFPCAMGGSCVLPTTTGKNVLLQLLLMRSNPDSFVYAMLGSSAELELRLRNFAGLQRSTFDDRHGPPQPVSERLVVVDGASFSEPAQRAQALGTAVSIAESLCVTSRHVLLIVDSLHDWAAALVAEADCLLLRTQLLCWAAVTHPRLGFASSAAAAADNSDVMAGVARALAQSPRHRRHAADGNTPGDFPIQEGVGEKIDALFARTGASRCRGSLTLLATLAPQDWAVDVAERDAVVARSLGATRTFWALDDTLRARGHHPSVNWQQSFSREPSAPVMRDGGESGAEGGVYSDHAKRRELIQQLLAEEEEVMLHPTGDKYRDYLTIVTAEMLRKDWLRQNVFDAVDSFCPPYKGDAMLRNMLLLHTLASAAASGATYSMPDVMAALRTFDPQDGRASYDLRRALSTQRWDASGTRAEAERVLDTLSHDLRQCFAELRRNHRGKCVVS
eukprot:SAG11_NODE_1156_length_5658_cov_10.848174_4_plen_529_part_00